MVLVHCLLTGILHTPLYGYSFYSLPSTILKELACIHTVPLVSIHAAFKVQQFRSWDESSKVDHQLLHAGTNHASSEYVENGVPSGQHFTEEAYVSTSLG